MNRTIHFLRKRFLMTVLIVSAAFLSTVIALGSIEREITLKSTTDVWSQEVCLGDMVVETWLRSRCALEPKKCCLWNLGGALSKTFSKAEVEQKIANIQLATLQLKLVGSKEVLVNQTKRKVTNQELKKLVVRQIQEEWGESDPKGIVVKEVVVPIEMYVSLEEEGMLSIQLPKKVKSEVAFQVVLESQTNNSMILGRATAKLAIYKDIFVAQKTIHAQELVGEKDFKLKKYDVLKVQTYGARLFTKADFPVGVRAKQTILSGAALTSAVVERIPLVRLGDTVTLILRSDNLKISTKGVVQGAAAVGDMVTVQLRRYSRTFRGKLKKGKLVEVWL